jgi:glycosyltransferase involved in cell wall biosynthesis
VTISLCMIVRDEEELLPGCLASARGLWDQLVVVDTGSRDATASIARAAGAELVEHAWDDDFAAARNAGLVRARGDLVVFIDADERLSPELVAELRSAADDPSVGAATFVMLNPLPGGHVRRTSLLRAFRRDDAIRFRCAIHEEVVTDVTAYLARTGKRLVHLAGTAEHLGYVRERAAAKGKKDRDVRILRRCLERDPDDLYSWFKLAEAASFWADRALLVEAARAAHARLDARTIASLKHAAWAGELLTLVARGVAGDDGVGELAVLDRWAEAVAPSAALLYRRGELRERIGDATGARADFERCLGLGDVTANEQLAGARPRMGLARLALAAGDLAGASAQVARVLAEHPHDREALLCGAALARATGGAAALDRFVGGYERRHGRTAELAATLAELGLVRAAV